jgi:hypothetical protein
MIRWRRHFDLKKFLDGRIGLVFITNGALEDDRHRHVSCLALRVARVAGCKLRSQFLSNYS